MWSLSSDVGALSAHLVATGHPSLEDAQALSDQVRAAVGCPFSLAHATFEPECERSETEDPCGMADQPRPVVGAGSAAN